MLKFIKSILPLSFKKFLMRIGLPNYKRYLVFKMHRKHQVLLNKIKNKTKIKVVFLVIHDSVWKLDSVFQKMLKDPFFEPVILVCPYVSYGEERMWEDMKKSYQFFSNKGYPLLSSYDNNEWVKLESIKPDIIFFTNPHNLTKKEYYEDAYLNYLSCFCGYGYIISKHGNTNFDQSFHAALWKNFVTDNDTFDDFKRYSTGKGHNSILVGSPAIEPLLNHEYIPDAWQIKDNRTKIIFAPHHTIEKNFELQLSNFLKYAEYFKKLALEYSENITWCFKPHPLLKPKLYKHLDWGKEKTESYYRWWEIQENTFYCDSDYYDLFIASDAMIHDSGSFLVEYLTQKKPVMYLTSENTTNTMNSLAKRALSACQHASTEQEIESFIVGLLDGTKKITKEHEQFYEEEFIKLYSDEQPSNRIISNIKNEILN